MSNNNVLSILPLVSILTAAVFISVHVASSGTKSVSSASANENVVGGPLSNGGGLVSFTYTPTTAPNSDLQFVAEPGQFDIFVGGNSAADKKVSFELTK